MRGGTRQYVAAFRFLNEVCTQNGAIRSIHIILFTTVCFCVKLNISEPLLLELLDLWPHFCKSTDPDCAVTVHNMHKSTCTNHGIADHDTKSYHVI